MTLKPPVRMLLPVVIGIAISPLMAAVMLNQPCRDFADTIPGFMPLYAAVHIPAKLMTESWHALHLPPHGDGAVFLYPRAVVVQWVLLGLLVGWVFLRCGNQRKLQTDRGS